MYIFTKTLVRLFHSKILIIKFFLGTKLLKNICAENICFFYLTINEKTMRNSDECWFEMSFSFLKSEKESYFFKIFTRFLEVKKKVIFSKSLHVS